MIEFPANAQVCTVMMSGSDPKVALSDISNDPSHAIQYWNVGRSLGWRDAVLHASVSWTHSAIPEVFPWMRPSELAS